MFTLSCVLVAIGLISNSIGIFFVMCALWFHDSFLLMLASLVSMVGLLATLIEMILFCKIDGYGECPYFFLLFLFSLNSWFVVFPWFIYT